MDNQLKEQVINGLKRGVTQIISTACGSLPAEVKQTQEIKIDSHKHREVLFVLDGTCNYYLDGHFYSLTPGTALFVEPWQEHEYYYSPEDHDLLHLWVALHPRRINAMLISLDTVGSLDRKYYFATCTGVVLHLFNENLNRIRNSKYKDNEVFALMLQRTFDLVLSELMYEVVMQYKEQPHKKREDIIVFINDYIRIHNGNDCSLAQLEKISGYTYYYLSHLYTSYYGKTIGAAVNEARMRYLLNQGWHANMKMIADALGFSSPSTFWKWRRNNRELEATLKKELEQSSDEENSSQSTNDK